jgi:RNA recognition motif-containing protein
MIHLQFSETPSSTLYLSGIPANQNTIHSLLKFFKRYGHIQSISASGTRANVCFAADESARQAYENPEPFLNNRFIKIHYHRNPRASESNLEQWIDRDLVSARCEEVEQQIASKLREQDEIQSSMLEQRRSKATIGEYEGLRKRKCDLVLEASKIVSRQLKGDRSGGERLAVLRQLIGQTQEAIDGL